MTDPTHVKVAIIGAGFAGLGMGIRLKMAKESNFVIFERAEELGGTWRDNIYPGCACDIHSIVYSFSFDQNPDWSRFFSTQPEILEYMKACAIRFNIYDHLRFNAEVIEARFDEDAAVWHVTTRNGDTITADLVVSGTGPLNRPNIPNLPGTGSFNGPVFHSSQWDTTFDPAGKRIAIIGTGASAIQIVPELAKTAEQLLVFQRTAPWVLSRGDGEASERRRSLFRSIPLFQKLVRGYRYWRLEIQVGNFLGIKWMNRYATRQAMAHIANSIQDPVLREAVTPDYKLGCKRVLFSSDYYPALTLDHVDLIPGGAQGIAPQGVFDADGLLHDVDAIIYCTGFQASEVYNDTKLYGLGGRELIQEWQENGMEAYYGTAVSGYPNLFFLLGPNTGLGHNSVVLMIESQLNYVMDYIKWLDRSGEKYFDIDPAVQAIHNEEIQERLESTVWQSGGCQSWYQQADGKNTTLWPGTTFGYRRTMSRVHKRAYRSPQGQPPVAAPPRVIEKEIR